MKQRIYDTESFKNGENSPKTFIFINSNMSAIFEISENKLNVTFIF